MARQISMATRQELIHTLGDRYRAASRKAKCRILDEFVAITGYHRKHAVRVLNAKEARGLRIVRARPRLYDEAVRQGLVVLWEAADRVCGKRLKPLIPTLIEALQRHGHLKLDPEVRSRLLQVSPATIDRLLGSVREQAGGARRRRAGAAPGLRRRVPVRTFADWDDPPPGYLEIDLVAHGGGLAEGSFVHTLVLTDIASGWTECVALVMREQSLVVEAITRIRQEMPFAVRGLDSDNDSVFINETLVDYCDRQGLELTRSRPYRKNDQAWVEQKNGAIVRRLVGYDRFEGMVAAQALARLYAAARCYVNFFQPSFKLKSKTRSGARVTKRYHAPLTPCERLLAAEQLADEAKDRLRQQLRSLDPLQLLKDIREIQQTLADLPRGFGPTKDAGAAAGDLDPFCQGLATAWQDGEVRPTHRRKPAVARTWRTRPDPFEAVWPTLENWLEETPDVTAKELLQRLQARHPGQFPDGQLRTLQRRVRNWRSEQARRLVFATFPAATTIPEREAP